MVSNPFRSPGLRASASVNVQEPAFATRVPLDIYAFHCYTENSGSPSITLGSQYHVPVSYTQLDVYKRQGPSKKRTGPASRGTGGA